MADTLSADFSSRTALLWRTALAPFRLEAAWPRMHLHGCTGCCCCLFFHHLDAACQRCIESAFTLIRDCQPTRLCVYALECQHRATRAWPYASQTFLASSITLASFELILRPSVMASSVLANDIPVAGRNASESEHTYPDGHPAHANSQSTSLRSDLISLSLDRTSCLNRSFSSVSLVSRSCSSQSTSFDADGCCAGAGAGCCAGAGDTVPDGVGSLITGGCGGRLALSAISLRSGLGRDSTPAFFSTDSGLTVVRGLTVTGSRARAIGLGLASRWPCCEACRSCLVDAGMPVVAAVTADTMDVDSMRAASLPKMELSISSSSWIPFKQTLRVQSASMRTAATDPQHSHPVPCLTWHHHHHHRVA
ncbi:hypothetical protein BC831DRAFT_74534 [Entophlyctis helioformis]|nr:hypothetical protein BC831DRAFT_74534 [Entophlyctis helioformis]